MDMKLGYSLLLSAVLILTACNDPIKPAALINARASLPASFNFSKLRLKVIASSINKKQNTMATLYGNDAALKSLNTGADMPGANSVLTLVTWQQQADDHWFGAKIPANLQSVEVINIGAGYSVKYQKYTGKNLVASADTTNNSKRIAFIMHTKPSVMP